MLFPDLLDVGPPFFDLYVLMAYQQNLLNLLILLIAYQQNLMILLARNAPIRIY